MATITTAKLRTDIRAILKGGDLSQLSSKKVRKQLGEKYGEDLTERKKEIDKLLMDLVTEIQNEADKSDSSESEADEPPPVKKSKPSPVKTQKKTENGTKEEKQNITELKHSKSDSDDDDSDFKERNDAELARKLQEEEDGMGRRTRGGRPARKSATKGKKKVKTPEKGEKKIKKGTGYGKPCVLSSQLSQIMGADKMARSDVVKRMWEIIRERELMDPKNKQFMLCDAELFTVFGRKRVRTFGMMKYLKDHIFQADEYEQMIA